MIIWRPFWAFALLIFFSLLGQGEVLWTDLLMHLLVCVSWTGPDVREAGPSAPWVVLSTDLLMQPLPESYRVLTCWCSRSPSRTEYWPADASARVRILDWSRTSQKLGQPLPESYLVVLLKWSARHTTQLNIRAMLYTEHYSLITSATHPFTVNKSQCFVGL